MMKSFTLVTVLVLCFACVVTGQQKSWSSWEKKEVDKILNDSPWGQTQTETDTSQMTFTPTTDKQPLSADGARNQSVDLKYRIRLFSARPVREAFARLIILGNPNLKPDQLKSFVEEDYSGWIVVAVAVESTDRRYSGPVAQKLASATTDTLKNSAYIERGDGKRIPVAEYAPPGSDGTGAKFFFPKVEEGGRPWLSAADTLRFVADYGRGTKISWRFKLSEMSYNGILEY